MFINQPAKLEILPTDQKIGFLICFLLLRSKTDVFFMKPVEKRSVRL